MSTLKAFDQVIYGRKTISVSGTAEILMAATATHSVTVKALLANTGDVYVGDSDVTTSNGYPLSPGETISIDVDHELASIYIDVDTNGEGVAFIAGTLL